MVILFGDIVPSLLDLTHTIHRGKGQTMRTTITNTKGQKFEAIIFDTRAEALAYATKNPVKVRNASGALIPLPAQIVTIKGGKFAVI